MEDVSRYRVTLTHLSHAAVVHAVIVSPAVVHAAIVSPAVVHAAIVSPAVVHAAIVSPAVVHAVIVSPAVVHAAIVSSAVAHAAVVSPVVVHAVAVLASVSSKQVKEGEGNESVPAQKSRLLNRLFCTLRKYKFLARRPFDVARNFRNKV